MKRITMAAVSCTALLTPTAAFASNWFIAAKLVEVQASNTPATIIFKVDKIAGDCATDRILYWTAQGADVPTQIANSQSIMALLLTAKAMNKNVNLGGFYHDGNGNCQVDFVSLSE